MPFTSKILNNKCDSNLWEKIGENLTYYQQCYEPQGSVAVFTIKIVLPQNFTAIILMKQHVVFLLF